MERIKTLFKRRVTFTYILFFLLVLPSFSEEEKSKWITKFGFQQIVLNNVFQYYVSKPDKVSSAFFDLSYRNSDELEFYYNGGLNYFAENTPLTNHNHIIGGSYSKGISEKSFLNISSDVKFSSFREDFKQFSYFQLLGSGELNYSFNETTLGKIYYLLRYRNYNDDFYNYFENYFSFQLIKSLRTKTALRIESGFGVKRYLGDLEQDFTTDYYQQSYYSGMGAGMGGMGQGRHSTQWRQQEHMGMRRYYVEGRNSITQFLLSGRVSQSILDNLGVFIQYSGKFNLTQGGRYSDYLNYYLLENPFYDEYTFEGNQIMAGFKLILPKGFLFQGEGQYSRRNFDGVPVLDLEGNLISADKFRKDDYSYFSLSVEKTFRFLRVMGTFISLRNNSNDLFFKYDDNIFSIGIASNF
ncbi:MAG: hypothetical protein AB1410_11515 [Acidobacteriota bacterium]